ncbi:MAG: TIR domain-containing protein, partial [Chloroflexota bacterium]
MSDPIINATHKQAIFISYARKDGREIATQLRTDLERRGFTIWQDVVAMEAGNKWWTQIKEAIDASAIMILVLTDAALASGIVHDEWTYARTVGTHVIPVTTDDKIFSKAPRWVGKVDVIILDEKHSDYTQAYARLLKQLNDPPERAPRPFTVPNLPEHFVNRPEQMDALIAHLLDKKQQNPVAITTALQGGGGFGKTTLAIALCHEDKVRIAFDDGILWLQFRQDMTQADLLNLLNTQIQLLAPDDNPLGELNAASARFRALLADRDMLIVLDDVWKERYLQHVVHEDTAYLITTRIGGVVNRARAKDITVDDMKTTEAADLLAKWLPIPPTTDEQARITDLAKRLGEWALLLELVGAELRSLMNGGRSLSDAIDYVVKRLERRGVTYLD